MLFCDIELNISENAAGKSLGERIYVLVNMVQIVQFFFYKSNQLKFFIHRLVEMNEATTVLSYTHSFQCSVGSEDKSQKLIALAVKNKTS